MGFELPPKLSLFTCKVLHQIFTVKDGLLKRGMDLEGNCVVYGGCRETTEHNFLHSTNTKTIGGLHGWDLILLLDVLLPLGSGSNHG